MKKTLAIVIPIFVCQVHTAGFCFVSHSPQVIETRNWQLETDVGSPLWKGGGGNAAGGLSLTYDALGKVAQTFLSAYKYDALGNRVVMDGKYFIPNHSDALKRPVIECNELGEIIRYYIWGDNRLLGFIDANNNLTVAHCDDFCSVIALTDLSGTPLYTANYGSHGEDWGSSGSNPTPFTWLGGYGVQVLETDTPLKLYLTRHRVYSATLNRFLSADPMGLEGGLNLYAYGEGNPMAYIDPLGLLSWSQVGYFVGGAVVGAAVAAAVVFAAPVAISYIGATLVYAGVSTATATTIATGTVSAGLLVAGGVGAVTTGISTYNAVQAKDWDNVAYNVGTLTGGALVGGLGGGRYLSEAMGGPSPAPRTANPITLLQYEWANRYQPSLGPPGFEYFATSPTPLSAGVTATTTSSGTISGANMLGFDTFGSPSGSNNYMLNLDTLGIPSGSNNKIK